MAKRRGFTLIELLVVIAIIALLLSILMPALRKVKEQAKMVGCLANLKQWNLIFAIYTQENEGKFFSGYGADAYWWLAQLPEKQQSYKQNPLWFCPKNTQPMRDEYDNPTNNFSIFASWGIHSRTSADGSSVLCEDGVSGSYSINGWVLATSGTPGATLAENRQVNDFWRTPDVRGAAEVPLMSEALRFDLWPFHTDPPAQDEMALWSANLMARTVINRHVGSENVSFCDYSARKVGLKEMWTFKWHKRFNTMGPYTQAGGMTAAEWPDWIRRFKDY